MPKNQSQSLSTYGEEYTLQHVYVISTGSKVDSWYLEKDFTLLFSPVISVIENTEAFSQTWNIVSKRQKSVSREREVDTGSYCGLHSMSIRPQNVLDNRVFHSYLTLAQNSLLKAVGSPEHTPACTACNAPHRGREANRPIADSSSLHSHFLALHLGTLQPVSNE